MHKPVFTLRDCFVCDPRARLKETLPTYAAIVCLDDSIVEEMSIGLRRATTYVTVVLCCVVCDATRTDSVQRIM